MLKSLKPLAAPLTALGVLLPATLWAHPGHDLTSGSLFAGLTHPSTGLDHLLVALAVGVWAWQLERADGELQGAWVLPAIFLSAMLAGGALAIGSVSLLSSEVLVAMSVLAMGCLVAAAMRLPLVGAAVVVGLFGAVHGNVHIAEVAGHANLIGYVVGLGAATAILHGLGVAAAHASARYLSETWARGAGALTAAAGLAFLGFAIAG